MKVEAKCAEKELGFNYLLQLLNAKLKSVRKLSEEIKLMEDDWDRYKKPGFRRDRKLLVVDELPAEPVTDEIYVLFRKDGYTIASGRNFIHRPVIKYGNLTYASIDEIKYQKDSVLRELMISNNAIMAILPR